VAYITTDPIDPAALMREIRPSDGGVCVFLGVVRNENDGKTTVSIQYEAYGPMAESEMAKIARQTEARWPGVRLLMRHRTGRLEIGEVSVAIVATAPHRDEAFAACRAAIDGVKTTVPIWKKEFHPDGSSDWVDPTIAGR
jgi:molybdopterin synthase catalytic subunit